MTSQVPVVEVMLSFQSDMRKKETKGNDAVWRKYNNRMVTKMQVAEQNKEYKEMRLENVRWLHENLTNLVTVRSHINKELRVDEDFFRWGVFLLKLSPTSELHYFQEQLKVNGFDNHFPNWDRKQVQMYECILSIERNLPDRRSIERDVGLLVLKNDEYFWLSINKDVSALWDRKARPCVIHDFSFDPSNQAYAGNFAGALSFVKTFKSSLGAFCNVQHHEDDQDDALPSSRTEYEEILAKKPTSKIAYSPYRDISAFQLVSCEWYANLALDRQFDFRTMLKGVAEAIGFDFDDFRSSFEELNEFQIQMACFKVLQQYEVPEYRLYLEHHWLKDLCCNTSVWYTKGNGELRILTIREAASGCERLRRDHPYLEYYHLGVRPFDTKIRSRGIAQRIAEISGYEWAKLSKKQRNRLVQIDWISSKDTRQLSDCFKWVSPFRTIEHVYFPEAILDADRIYCPKSDKEREVLLTETISDFKNFHLVPNMIMQW